MTDDRPICEECCPICPKCGTHERWTDETGNRYSSECPKCKAEDEDDV